jgi:hypothetical protein
MSKIQILALIVLAVVATILAAPRLKDSYVGAQLLGTCRASPSLPECRAPLLPGRNPAFDAGRIR